MALSITVLIAVAGKNTALEKTLSSLVRCKKPENYRGTIVVENGTQYDAEQITERYRNILSIKYLYLSKGNKSAALNYALENITEPSSLIFFTDDDGSLAENTLLEYEAASRQISNKCFFGGPMKVEYEEVPPAWLIEALPPSAKGWAPNDSDDYLRTPRFLGINWAAFADDIKKLGGFNENLGPGTKPKRTGQEWDMQSKMLNANFRAIYVANAVAWHYVPKSRSSFRWFIKRRFQGGLGAGMSFVEKNEKKVVPIELIKYLTKACLLLPLRILSLSRAKTTVELGNIAAGLGRMKGYFTARFSSKF